VSLHYNFIWYRVAKTGTRSVDQFLEDHIADYEYLTGNDAGESYRKCLANSPYTFSFVRHPMDRLASAWRNKIRDNGSAAQGSKSRPRRRRLGLNDADYNRARKDFDFFVSALSASVLLSEDIHFKPQSEILKDLKVGFIGRFENLGPDFDIVKKAIFLGDTIPQSLLPRKNETIKSKVHDEKAYSNEVLGTVAELYAEDFSCFGYSIRMP